MVLMCKYCSQVSFVGLTEEAAREAAEAGGFATQVAVVRSSFKANSKALAEKEGEGIAKMIYRYACPLARTSLPQDLSFFAAILVHSFSVIVPCANAGRIQVKSWVCIS